MRRYVVMKMRGGHLTSNMKIRGAMFSANSVEMATRRVDTRRDGENDTITER